jgi:hypothetical protein
LAVSFFVCFNNGGLCIMRKNSQPDNAAVQDSRNVSVDTPPNSVNCLPKSIITLDDIINEPPSKTNSDWFKLSDGEQAVIRFMASWLLCGEESWDDGQVTRWEMGQAPDKARYKNLRKFWCQIIFNYDLDEFQLFQWHQIHKYEALQGIAKKHGSFNACDILIHRSGSDKQTRYTLIAQRPTVLDPAIQARYEALNIDMNQVFNNGNPLKPQGDLPWNK